MHQNITNSTNNKAIVEMLSNIWEKDVKQEEEKSTQIWLVKQKWLHEYGSKFQNEPKPKTQSIKPKTNTINYQQNTRYGTPTGTHSKSSTSVSQNNNLRTPNETSKSNANSPDATRIYPHTKNGTTFIGQKVKTQSFLEQCPYDKKGGGNSSDKRMTRQTRSMTNQLKQQKLFQK